MGKVRRLAPVGLLLLSLGMLRGNEVRAAADGWVPLPGPAGAVTRLAADPREPQYLLAVIAGGNRPGVSPGNALYRSTDSGLAWSPLSNSLDVVEVTALAVRSGRPQTIFVGTGAGLYRSSDGGRTWLPLRLEPEGAVVALAVTGRNPDVIYALARENVKYPSSWVYRSVDGGQSWKGIKLEEYPAGPPYGLVVDPAVTTNVYVTTRTHLYKSMDGGATWTVADQGLLIAGRPATVAVDPATPNTIYVAGQYVDSGEIVVYRSDNGGASWREQSRGIPGTGAVVSLQVEPSESSTLYLGTTSGVFRSSDGGINWSMARNGLGNTGVNQLLPQGSKIVWAATGNGLYRSDDGAVEWRPYDAGLPLNGWVSALATDPRQPPAVYAGARLNAYSPAGAGVLKSTDGGSTWQPANLGLTNPHLETLVIDPASPDVLYAGTLGGIFKSTDGAATWAPLPLAVPFGSASGPQVLSVAVDPTNSRLLYAGLRNWGLYRSADGGATWTPTRLAFDYQAGRAPSVYAIAVDPRQPSVVYAVTAGHGVFCPGALFKSGDGGTTWAPVAPGGPLPCDGRSLVMDPASSQNLVLGTVGSGVYRSQDGGRTWVSGLGLPAGSTVSSLVADPRYPLTMYAAVDGAGVYHSTDGGANWRSVGMLLGDNRVTALAVDYSGQGPALAGTQAAGVWRLSSLEGFPSPPTAVDARIEIVWPQGGAPVTAADRANVGVRLFYPDSLVPPPCWWRPTVRLWTAVNDQPPSFVGMGQQQSVQGHSAPYWEVNDVDVSPARSPANRVYFMVTVDEARARSSVWSHGADARTYFPYQDRPEGITSVTEAEAKIQIVWPHDRDGFQQPVAEAPLANIAVDIYQRGTRLAPPLDWEPRVVLYRALNHGVIEPIATGAKTSVSVGGITYPRWLFNDVDVSAAQDGRNTYFFQVAVEGLPSRGSIWGHGADARTYFPQMDEPISGCR